MKPDHKQTGGIGRKKSNYQWYLRLLQEEEKGRIFTFLQNLFLSLIELELLWFWGEHNNMTSQGAEEKNSLTTSYFYVKQKTPALSSYPP